MRTTTVARRQSDLGQFGFDDAIRSHAAQRANEAAFVEGDRASTWRAFDRNVAQVAEALMALGVTKGERVALLASNSIWTYEAMFGIARAGAVVTPISTLLPRLFSRAC